MCWSGTANFNGLQINAGGHFEIIGGGGRTTTGAIIMSKLLGRYGVSNPDFAALRSSDTLRDEFLISDLVNVDFATTGLRFNGGGSHNIVFRCETGADGIPGFVEYAAHLNACLEPSVLIEANCGPGAGTGTGLRQVIASWREYIDRTRWPN